ncbi:MAG: hypothetical protein EPO23_05210 [Xanthobacteraceae bacterium]|nr:MAG: hypothetical protein EPO23_05210 [Xanthobacteraceae bacterium]
MATAHKYFPRHLILAGAPVCGMLLALAVHMLGLRFGLDLGGLWHGNGGIPATAAVAWWLIATVALAGSYMAARLMNSPVSGKTSRGMRQLLVVVVVVVLAAAGQAAAAPSGAPSLAGLLAGLAALLLGAVMAFCGVYFALHRT